MKKLTIVFAILLIIANVASAQSDSTKFFQKITGGVILGTFAEASFHGDKMPFSLGYNLSPVITFVTPKTYHNILYGFGNNSLRSLNGYFLKKDWDVYFIYSGILHTGDNYLGVGIEKMIKFENKKAGVKFFLLTELGTDFKGNRFLSFGLLMYPFCQLWKRE